MATLVFLTLALAISLPPTTATTTPDELANAPISIPFQTGRYSPPQNSSIPSSSSLTPRDLSCGLGQYECDGGGCCTYYCCGLGCCAAGELCWNEDGDTTGYPQCCEMYTEHPCGDRCAPFSAECCGDGYYCPYGYSCETGNTCCKWGNTCDGSDSDSDSDDYPEDDETNTHSSPTTTQDPIEPPLITTTTTETAETSSTLPTIDTESSSSTETDSVATPGPISDDDTSSASDTETEADTTSQSSSLDPSTTEDSTGKSEIATAQAAPTAGAGDSSDNSQTVDGGSDILRPGSQHILLWSFVVGVQAMLV